MLFSIIIRTFALGTRDKTMKLIILTKPTFFVEEDQILTALFEEGMEHLHLYKPNQEPVFSERLLTLLDDDYYRKITVHNHFYLREEYGLRGIHLDNVTDELPYGYRGTVSRTCRSLSVLADAKRRSSYVFLQNIFDSQSNPADKSTLTMDELREASRRGLIDKKVYAMGGMKLDNIGMAKDLGFGGVVICGDLWNRFDIHNELDYKELLQHFERLKKAID